MKLNFTKMMFLFISLMTLNYSVGQCNYTSAYGSGTASNTTGVTVTLTTCQYAGEYATISGIIGGGVYRVNVSTTTNYVTVRSGSPSGPVVYFGLQGVNWTAPTSGTYYAHISNNATCATSTTCRTTSVTTMLLPLVAPNPCASISTVSCGGSASFNLIGTGAWTGLGGPYATPGKEKIISFTASTTGAHAISITNNEYYVDLYYKSTGCSSTGWTYVDDIYTGTATNTLNLTAGVTYLFLIDDENSTASTGTLSVACPTAAPSPCGTSIINIASCGTTTAYSITAGAGLWNYYGGPYAVPGRERVLKFTPTVTASYPITITNTGSGWVDFFYKINGGGTPCSSTGWTYVDDINSSATNNLVLTAGVTYLFLLDDEDNLGSSGSVSIGCPCIGNSIDGNYTYSAPLSISGNTFGACDNSSLRVGEELTYQINITCSAAYTFSTCGSTWDTYLILSSAPGASMIASNDDACGLQSSLTANLAPGTYYISVEPYSASGGGAFTLNVSSGSSASVIGVNTVNISCNGGSDGSITLLTSGSNLTYSINGGPTQTSNTFSGLTAGTYTVTMHDCLGNTTNTLVTLSAPTALIPTSVATPILCNGGTTDLVVTATGGTAPYSGIGTYNVPAGNYNILVTDANGCSANAGTIITEPTVLVATSVAAPILCNGGTTDLVVNASGGTAPYSGTGTTTVAAGNYSTIVTDANGCTSVTDITISEPTPLVASSSAGTILCNGGTTTLEVAATGGAAPYSGTGMSIVGAGDYSLVVTDANGCTSATQITISEPSLLVADAGNNATVYYGYDPMACTSLSSDASGGTPGYSFSWSGGTSTVCPTTSTNYTLTVTDANGCTATDDVHVCVVDVICFAGSSSIQKVEICHNGNTICVNASAVPAHLAHGCSLGSCDEVNQCNNGASMMVYNPSQRRDAVLDEHELQMEVYPNPSQGVFNLDVHLEDQTATSYSVYNNVGELLFTEQLTDGINEIDLSGYADGLYIIRVDSSILKVTKF